MNQDPKYQKLREILWRRPLTEPEQSELCAWLAAHPEAQAEVEAEDRLNAALAQWPEAAVPSNFTARVMQAIERDATVAQRAPAPRPSWWQVLRPRLAAATAVLLGGFLIYQHNAGIQQQELTNAARQVAAAESLSDPAVMADFEVIASLSPMAVVADEKLLALSDDLLALHQ